MSGAPARNEGAAKGGGGGTSPRRDQQEISNEIRPSKLELESVHVYNLSTPFIFHISYSDGHIGCN